jgi:formylglycine-generating enzyme required for sulfatase activity
LDLAVEMPPGKVFGLLEVLKEFEKTEMAGYVEVKKYALPETMVFIPGGTFIMGDVMGDSKWDEELFSEMTLHEVTLDSFCLGKYAVTFEEYDLFCEIIGMKKPSDEESGRGKKPVFNVDWYDAVLYCNWLSTKEGFEEVYTITEDWVVTANWKTNGYRLPTEAEWEYAARGAGKKVRFGNGKDIAKVDEINFSGREGRYSIRSFRAKIHNKTVPVGSLAPNPLGLYEMSGNIWEWCWDSHQPYSSNAQKNPKGSEWNKYFRMMRGGSWGSSARECRSTFRCCQLANQCNSYTGFRLVFVP